MPVSDGSIHAVQEGEGEEVGGERGRGRGAGRWRGWVFSFPVISVICIS